MTAHTMHCPTCRATQIWSDVCRRCKSDLRMLRAIAEVHAQLRERCLCEVRRDRPPRALELALQCRALRDDAATRRLVAVCELLNGNWSAARTLAVQLLAESSADDRRDLS